MADGIEDEQALAGHNVYLTIDQGIQYTAERELMQSAREFEAAGGSVVVIDPNSGEILALASWPMFNPNDYGDAEPEENVDFDWTDARIVWFCEYNPLIALKEPLTIDDIRQDRLLAGWWKGKPYRGGPKRIARQDIARRLVELILTKNPKDRRLARFIQRFLEQKG